MKMKKAIIGMLAGLFLLSFAVVSQAGLSPNLLSNYDFETTGLTKIESGNLSSGRWYIEDYSRNWSRDSYNGNDYAHIITSYSRHLFQAVSISTAWPGHTATAGEVKVSFDYQSYLGLIFPGSFTVTVYGYNSQPTASNFTNGIIIGTITGLGSVETWTNVSRSFMADAGYSWYVIDFLSELGGVGAGIRYLNIDNVSLQVTPIPAAAWLLATGLIGLVGVRRRWIKS